MMGTAQTQQRHALFIGGADQAPASGEYDQVINPANGEVIAEVPRAGAADVDRAVAAASSAFRGWAHTTPGERATTLLKLADRVEAEQENLAQLESANVGKPMGLAREEMSMIVDHLRFFAGAARVLEGRAAAEYTPGHTSFIRRDPLGVVGSVAPWNYPLLMAIWKICPALMTGNTLVLKPSEHTPLTLLRLAELSAGLFPDGVLNIVTGDGEVAGAHLVSHPDVRMSSLTGDVGTGRALLRASADSNLKRLHLELGGKAPVLILPDADIELTVSKLMDGSFCNSGQDCMAASRLYVSDAIYDDFRSAFSAAVGEMAVGDPADESTTMGPVITGTHKKRVDGFVERAGQTGHVDLFTGSAPDGRGFFVAPTLVFGAQQRDEIVQREVFGPVVSVTKFGDNDDLVELANDVDYGLAASIFTSDVSRALRISRDIQFGTVWINDHLPVVPEMPHGGFKQSGNGNDMSVYSLEEYTEIKHVMINIGES
jgi:betaine-aldehyde dehydrogenase/aminobutyraldehyde dehydrogenase